MDGHLDGLENIFADYKRKLEEQQASSTSSKEAAQRRVEALKNTAKRRRLMKKHMEEKITSLSRELREVLAEVQGQPVVQSDEEKLYYQLKVMCFYY